MNSLQPRPCVLYVENNPDDVLLFQLAYRKAKPGFDFRTLESIAAARNYLLGAGQYFDRQLAPFPVLVLLDYSLNGEVGVQLLRCVRESTTTQHLTVVMFSGEEEPERIQECYQAGANYFISKMVGPKDLVEFIQCLDQCLSTSPPCFDGLLTLKQYQFTRRMSGGVGC